MVKEDISLNIEALDIEWQKQSSLMEEYSSALAGANRDFNNLKIILDQKIAQYKFDWRTQGEVVINNKKTKITEGSLDDGINNIDEIIQLKKSISEKQYEIDVLKGIVEALRNKKSALEYEVQLFLSGYFGEPNNQQNLMQRKQRQN